MLLGTKQSVSSGIHYFLADNYCWTLIIDNITNPRTIFSNFNAPTHWHCMSLLAYKLYLVLLIGLWHYYYMHETQSLIFWASNWCCDAAVLIEKHIWAYSCCVLCCNCHRWAFATAVENESERIGITIYTHWTTEFLFYLFTEKVK